MQGLSSSLFPRHAAVTACSLIFNLLGDHCLSHAARPRVGGASEVKYYKLVSPFLSTTMNYTLKPKAVSLPNPRLPLFISLPLFGHLNLASSFTTPLNCSPFAALCSSLTRSLFRREARKIGSGRRLSSGLLRRRGGWRRRREGGRSWRR